MKDEPDGQGRLGDFKEVIFSSYEVGRVDERSHQVEERGYVKEYLAQVQYLPFGRPPGPYLCGFLLPKA